MFELTQGGAVARALMLASPLLLLQYSRAHAAAAPERGAGDCTIAGAGTHASAARGNGEQSRYSSAPCVSSGSQGASSGSQGASSGSQGASSSSQGASSGSQGASSGSQGASSGSQDASSGSQGTGSSSQDTGSSSSRSSGGNSSAAERRNTQGSGAKGSGVEGSGVEGSGAKGSGVEGNDSTNGDKAEQGVYKTDAASGGNAGTSKETTPSHGAINRDAVATDAAASGGGTSGGGALHALLGAAQRAGGTAAVVFGLWRTTRGCLAAARAAACLCAATAMAYDTIACPFMHPALLVAAATVSGLEAALAGGLLWSAWGARGGARALGVAAGREVQAPLLLLLGARVALEVAVLVTASGPLQ
eukprot:245438-Chlamydomonas_euryale.AAC.2